MQILFTFYGTVYLNGVVFYLFYTYDIDKINWEHFKTDHLLSVKTITALQTVDCLEKSSTYLALNSSAWLRHRHYFETIYLVYSELYLQFLWKNKSSR
jgi:hypothetical protein